MFAKTYGGALSGVDAARITIEVTIAQGLRTIIVGLPDSAVKESQQRVESALQYYDFKIPRKRVVVNFAPADVRKVGSSYDLPMALCLLKASDQIHGQDLESYMIMGELSLDGDLRPIHGALPVAIEANRLSDIKGLILPIDNAQEAAIVSGLPIYGVRSLQEAIDLVEGKAQAEELLFHSHAPEQIADFPVVEKVNSPEGEGEKLRPDFQDVQGQEIIKRGMEIAAAGGHNLLMIGPPGAGKTMLASRLGTILPPMSIDESLETTKIHSVTGRLGKSASLIADRPFRAPHHTISDVALVGGGSIPQAGEISLAHNGVLFLDELPEFKRAVLEVLRQPLEERQVTISRARMTAEFPANFMLVASMNPCPCGYYNHPEKQCTCKEEIVRRYLNKISGPLLDRIDLHVEVTPVSFDEMTAVRKAESSASIRARIISARNIQAKRFARQPGIFSNAMIPSHRLQHFCPINASSKSLLKRAMEHRGLSARAYSRILKVSRTIADLAGSETIESMHIAEAINFRSLDREDYGKSS